MYLLLFEIEGGRVVLAAAKITRVLGWGRLDCIICPLCLKYFIPRKGGQLLRQARNAHVSGVHCVPAGWLLAQHTCACRLVAGKQAV